MTTMERIVKFEPAYDKRNDPKGNFGIHCVTLRMMLKGPLGAVQFVLYTGWYVHTISAPAGDTYSWDYRINDSQRLDKPMPCDLGYHSPTPRYEGQSKMEPCEYLEQGFCYYDGSGLNAYRIFYVLVNEGDAGVWRELEDYYHSTFETKPVEAAQVEAAS